MMDLIAYIAGHPTEILGAVSAALTGVIAIFMLVPGDAPEKQLKAIVDFLAKFSKK